VGGGTKKQCMSQMGAIARGALAGAVGTVAMDVIWFARYRRGSGTSTFIDWEFARGLRDWRPHPHRWASAWSRVFCNAS